MVAENIDTVRRRIAAACSRSGRNPSNITLIAVTKTFPADAILECVAAGVCDIGENYVQELTRKQEELGDAPVRWHFIGHLQRNKVREVVPTVHLIHAVDSLRLGREISAQAMKLERVPDIFVEVNTSGETSKFGVTPEDTEQLVEELSLLPGLRVRGLMTIGPFLPDPEGSRPAFRQLRLMRERLLRRGMDVPHLSMGMSNDFEVAIEEGSTMIRIGTLLFGKRATSRM